MTLQSILACSIPDEPGYRAPQARQPLEEAQAAWEPPGPKDHRDVLAARRSEFRALIGKHPGVSALELGLRTGLSPSLVYDTVRALEDAGTIVHTVSVSGARLYSLASNSSKISNGCPTAEDLRRQRVIDAIKRSEKNLRAKKPRGRR
jgi:hypothetical protein